MYWFSQNVLIFRGELAMHRFPIFLIVSAIAFAEGPILAQQQASPTAPTATTTPTTEGSIPDAKPVAPCVILKRMGPADEITSHLYSFGIRGKQFQYVEGNLPQGISFHGRLTDHDARKILDKAGKIQIVEPKYTPADLDAARRQCSGLPPVA